MASAVDYSAHEWIFDSDCSFHIYPKRELLSDFSKLDGGIVRLGNCSCLIHVIGNAKVRRSNGMVRLKEVWYILNFKSNLISLGVLELSGLKIVMEKGALKYLNWAHVSWKGQ